MPGAADLIAYTPNTKLDARDLESDINKIKDLGYAVSFEERDIGAVGITAPVFDRQNDMVGAIGISGPIQRLDVERAHDLVPFVRAAAYMLSEQLGYEGNLGRPTGDEKGSAYVGG